MIVDISFLVYCLWGAYRGRRRKLSGMLYRLFRMLIAVAAGVSLFRLIGDFLSKYTGAIFSDSLGFLLAFILPLAGMRVFHRSLSRLIEGRIGTANESKWGSIVGFVNHFFVASTLLITLSLSGESYIYRFFSKSSLMIKFYTFILNVF